jgi:hypothetical protein
VNTIEWQKEADPVLASANIEDVRFTFFANVRNATDYEMAYFQPESRKLTSQNSLCKSGREHDRRKRLAALKYLVDFASAILLDAAILLRAP